MITVAVWIICFAGIAAMGQWRMSRTKDETKDVTTINVVFDGAAVTLVVVAIACTVLAN